MRIRDPMRAWPIPALLAALFFCGSNAIAQDSNITYQGQLQQDGVPFSGTANLEFRLFDQLVGGTQVGTTQTRNNWPVDDGLFQADLDFGPTAFDGNARYLEVRVDGQALTPRQPVRAAPVALFALAGNQGPPGDSHWLINGSATYYNAGNVGIGTSNPAWPLDISAGQAVGRMVSTASVNGSVIELRNNTASPTLLGAINFVNAAGQFRGQLAYTGNDELTLRVGGAERLRIDGSGRLGIGTVSPSFPLHVESAANSILGATTSTGGYGVGGSATAATGLNYGVLGQSDSTSGIGVHGLTTKATGSSYGVWGQSNSVTGRGVFGSVTQSTGLNTGVWGESASTDGRGVYGWATHTTGINYGVYGESQSTSGAGIFGRGSATTGSNSGVRGASVSTAGTGVHGVNLAASGVNYGVRGTTASASAFDFFADGAGTDYGSASSVRWKQNITPIDDALERTGRLRGVFFDWDEAHGGHHDIGMIAEEVGAVLPEIVRYEENGSDAIGMDYAKVVPLLVAAINALREEKDSEIAALWAEIEALRSGQVNP